MLSGLFNGCQKDLINIESSQVSKIEGIKRAFLDNQSDKDLSFKTSDTSEIVWVPLWDQLQKRTDNDNALYIPLVPELRTSTKSVKLRLFNQKQCLVVTNEKYFSKAFFNSKGTTLKASKSDDFDLNKFSGELVLEDLKAKRAIKYQYKNGIIEVNSHKRNNKRYLL